MPTKSNTEPAAWLCPLIAIGIIAIAYAYASSPFWWFVNLGIALLTSLLGSLLCLFQLAQKNQSRLKTIICLGANICVAAFSAIYLFGAIVIGIGFAM